MDHCRQDPVHRLKEGIDPDPTKPVRATLTEEPGLYTRGGSHSVEQVDESHEASSCRRSWPVTVLTDELWGHAADPRMQGPRAEPSLGLAKGLVEQEVPGCDGPL